MKKSILILIFGSFLATHPLHAKSLAPHVVPLTNKAKPTLDGSVATGEYAASFTDAKTGVTVSWQADGQNLYVGLQSPGSGWIAAGFGKKGMRGSSMVIGSADESSQWTVREDLGKAFYRHGPVEKPKLVGGKVGLKDGKTVMEFVLPLALSSGRTIEPGKPVPFTLALHSTKPRLSKHSKKMSAQLLLQAQSPAQ
jgi:hypothetical protein